MTALDQIKLAIKPHFEIQKKKKLEFYANARAKMNQLDELWNAEKLDKFGITGCRPVPRSKRDQMVSQCSLEWKYANVARADQDYIFCREDYQIEHVEKVFNKKWYNCAKGLEAKALKKLDGEAIDTFVKTVESQFCFEFLVNDKFVMSVEAIYAGGYNIQCLHVRIITKFRKK